MASPGQKGGACGHLMAGFDKRGQKSVVSDKPTRSDKPTEDDSTLVDPSLVSVIGVATANKMAGKSPERAGSKAKSKKKHSTPVKKSSTHAKLETVDQKWSERFSCLEAFLLLKCLDKSNLEQTFQQ